MALKPISDEKKKGWVRVISTKENNYAITFNSNRKITFSSDLTAYFVKQNDGSDEGMGVNIHTKDGTDSKGKKRGTDIIFEVVEYGDDVDVELKLVNQNKRFQINATHFIDGLGISNITGKRWGNSAITVEGSGIVIDTNKRSVNTKKTTSKDDEKEKETTPAPKGSRIVESATGALQVGKNE